MGREVIGILLIKQMNLIKSNTIYNYKHHKEFRGSLTWSIPPYIDHFELLLWACRMDFFILAVLLKLLN